MDKMLNKYNKKMFCEKYKPNNLENFIGNSNAVIQMNNWLVDWQNSDTKTCILSGKTGIGKSLLAELFANKYGYFICNVENHTNSLEKVFNLTKTITNIFRKKNILIIDDIDCADTAFIGGIIQCVKQTLIPIIITCNDFYEKKIRTLVGLCFSVKLYPPTFEQIFPFAINVAKNENLKITKNFVSILFEQSNGDIRYFLNNLQTLISDNSILYKGENATENNKDLQNNNIFETTQQLFMNKNFETKWKTYFLNEQLHSHFLYGNYPNHIFNDDILGNIKRLYSVADCFSDADIIIGTYQFELSQYVVSNNIRATSFCNKKSNIVFPKFMGMGVKKKQTKFDFSMGFNANNADANTNTNVKKIKNLPKGKCKKNTITKIVPKVIPPIPQPNIKPKPKPKPKPKKLPKNAKIRKNEEEIKNSKIKLIVFCA